MSLNPRIEKDAAGTYWLRWTPDVTAEGYAFVTPGGASRTFDPLKAQAKLGKNLVEPVVASVAALDVTARAAEAASYPPVVTPPPVGTPAFGSRPDTPSKQYNGQNDIVISNKTIRTSTTAGGGTGTHSLSFINCRNITILDVDMICPSSGLYFQGCTGTITIGRCRASGLGWNFAQFNDCTMGGRIFDCKAKGGKHEDIISFFKTSGLNAANPIIVEDCQFEGVDWTSASGTGCILGEYGSNYLTYRRNTLLNPGQVGVGIRGSNCVLADNKIVKEKTFGRGGSGDLGVYVWADTPAYPMNDVQLLGNKVMWWKADGASQNNYWNAGNATNVVESGNSWGFPFTAAEINAMRVVL